MKIYFPISPVQLSNLPPGASPVKLSCEAFPVIKCNLLYIRKCLLHSLKGFCNLYYNITAWDEPGPKNKGYAHMKHWTDMLNSLIEKLLFPQIVHRILLWSPEPGTGKSSYAHHRFGSDKVERVTLHGRMVPDDLLFQVDLESDNGGTKTVRRAGPALRAMMEGKILVLDEIDQHDPAMRCLLHALLDDRAIAGVTLPDGQRVTPKDGFAVIATTNKTPTQFPVALLDRFDIALNCSSPHPEVFKTLPDEVKSALTNRYARIDVQPWRAELSVRRAISFSKLQKLVGDEEASRMVFGDAWQDMLSSFALSQASENQNK